MLEKQLKKSCDRQMSDTFCAGFTALRQTQRELSSKQNWLQGLLCKFITWIWLCRAKMIIKKTSCQRNVSSKSFHLFLKFNLKYIQALMSHTFYLFENKVESTETFWGKLFRCQWCFFLKSNYLSTSHWHEKNNQRCSHLIIPVRLRDTYD